MKPVDQDDIDDADLFLPHKTPEKTGNISRDHPGEQEQSPEDVLAAELAVYHKRYKHSYRSSAYRDHDRIDDSISDRLEQPDVYGTADVEKYVGKVLEPNKRRHQILADSELVELEEGHIDRLEHGEDMEHKHAQQCRHDKIICEPVFDYLGPETFIPHKTLRYFYLLERVPDFLGDRLPETTEDRHIISSTRPTDAEFL